MVRVSSSQVKFKFSFNSLLSLSQFSIESNNAIALVLVGFLIGSNGW